MRNIVESKMENLSPILLVIMAPRCEKITKYNELRKKNNKIVWIW